MPIQLQNINATVQFTEGEGKAWSDPAVVVPIGVWVFNTETNAIYQGDGTKLITELPIFWDIGQGDRAATKFDQLPKNLVGYPSKLLIVNDTGTGYIFSTLNIAAIVTESEFVGLLNGISNSDHTHGDLYYTKDEVIAKAAANTSFGPGEADIISYLVLEAMDSDNEAYKLLPNGVADEFETTIGVSNTSSAVYSSTPGKYAVRLGYLLTISSAAATNITSVRSLSRCQLNGNPISSVDVEVSRDGGTTFCIADSSKSKLKCGNFEFLTSECDFTHRREVVEYGVADMAVPDYKGSITTFTVDVANSTGHFDAGAVDVYAGYTVTTADGSFGIVSMVGDGTAVGSVKFTGTLGAGAHAVSAIRGIELVSGTSDQLKLTAYTNISNLWAKLADGPSIRYHHSAVAIDGKMYVHGGNNNGVRLKDTYVYDPATDIWTKLADGPSVRSQHSVVAIDGKMYVHAGYNSSSTYLKDTYVYDPATNIWTKLADGPSVRSHHSAIAIGGKMYVHGGYNGSTYYKDTYVYDPATNIWTKSVDAPVARSGHSAVAIGGKMYVHGGYTSSALQDTYVFAYPITVSSKAGITLPITNSIISRLIASGDSLDSVVVFAKINDIYNLNIGGIWTPAVRYNLGVWEWFNGLAWSSVSPNTKLTAMNAALAHASTALSLLDIEALTLPTASITELELMLMTSAAILSGVHVYTKVPITAPPGKSICTKITNHDDTIIDIHGLRTRWN